MEDLAAQHPAPVEDRLILQAAHSARHPVPAEDRLVRRAGRSVHLRVFPKGLAVSSVAALAAAVFPVGIRSDVFLVAIRSEAFPVAIPSVAASLVVTDSAEAADKSSDKLP